MNPLEKQLLGKTFVDLLSKERQKNISSLVILKERNSFDQGSDFPPADKIINVSKEFDNLVLPFERPSPEFARQIEEDRSILMVVSRLEDPLEYGIFSKNKSDLWGLFYHSTTDNDNSRDFELLVYTTTPTQEVLLSPEQNVDSRFIFDPILLKMIEVSKMSTNQIKNPVLISTINNISSAIQSLSKIKNHSVIVREYLESLTVATKKFLVTDKDEFVFFGTLNNLKFKDKEFKIRKTFWEVESDSMLYITSLLHTYVEDLEVTAKQDVDKNSLLLACRVLYALLANLHSSGANKLDNVSIDGGLSNKIPSMPSMGNITILSKS